MKIAITGLSGFMGHYVAKKLFERDVHIQALVRSTSNTSHLNDYEEKITFVPGDMGDRGTLKKFVQDSDVVIHMAYERDGTGFHEAANKDFRRFLDVNLSGSTKVSPGCQHCYAGTMARRLKAMGVNGYKNGFKLTLQPHRLYEPLRRKKPTIYFVNSMSDLFHEKIKEISFFSHLFIIAFSHSPVRLTLP